jgi:lysine 2,3-aminomutase
MDFPYDDARWADWTWQYRNRITRIDQLAGLLSLSDMEQQDITACLGHFRMAITPYYASLINPDDPADPIRRQAVPAIHETCVLPCEMSDPLSEERDSPVQHIVHRYPDRVLFLVTHQCAMYCRHCTRRRLVGEEDHVISEAAMEQALAYIRDRVQIRDVLISGGDPLTLSDTRLEQIVASLRQIEHVEIIRIGTRVPVVMPMRITPGLLAMLKNYQPIWINTHFNHPRELTDAAIEACGAIVDAGIPLGNQSVLLKGINDDVATMKELLLKLVKARIRPYYLYQCDLSQGLGHFRTDVRTGIEIIRQLTGNISGYAIPRFVIDAPGGGGKIAVNPDTIVSIDDQQIVLHNYQDKICVYPQPTD